MNITPILNRLLAIGRTGNFDSLAEISELSSHRSVCRLADVYRDDVVCFAKGLANEDQIAFTKVVAMLEYRVGGLGSVTNVERLLQLIVDPERACLEWIYRNTRWHGVSSIEALDRNKAWYAASAAESTAREEQRQLAHKKRIAAVATQRLYNAVRRGDVKAVRALITKGADVTALASDGPSLVAEAAADGHEEILNLLRNNGAL